MNLIAYSDSEDSENEAPSAPQPVAPPAPKSAFRKVVSKPGTIRLNLPAPTGRAAAKEETEADAPPAKKPRTGGGAFGGFNAMLPAPKKANATAAPVAPPPPSTEADKNESTEEKASSSRFSAVKAAKPNFNFMKTGAEPMFRRQPAEPDYDDEGNPVQKSEPRAQPSMEASLKARAAVQAHNPEVKFAGRKFMPLSAARKNKGRRPVPYASAPTPVPAPAKVMEKAAALGSETQAAPATKLPSKKKVSLFGSVEEDDSGAGEHTAGGDYEPLLYGAEDDEAHVPDDAVEGVQLQQINAAHYPVTGTGALAASSHLTDIAAELHLSEAERRQLFGRKGKGDIPDSVNLVEFNTDKEYAHNEELRAQGETVQHNALKSISGTGKNSLRSLINVATTQKDALEEHFAQGRRNKREAGSKYGW